MVKSHHKWPVKPIVAEKLQLLSIVIPCQCLLRALHVKDVQEEVWVLVLELVVEGCAVDTEVGRRLRVEVLLEDRLPDALVAHKDLRQLVPRRLQVLPGWVRRILAETDGVVSGQGKLVG